jgi:hypothetical protein
LDTQLLAIDDGSRFALWETSVLPRFAHALVAEAARDLAQV